MTGIILPFQRNENKTPEALSTFWVTLRPKTRGKGTPIELMLVRNSPQQAIADAIKEQGLTSPDEFNFLECLVKVGYDETDNRTTWRVAYYNTTRCFSADYDTSFPVRKGPPGVIVQTRNLTPPTCPATTVVETKKEEKEDGDDYKEAHWYEVERD